MKFLFLAGRGSNPSGFKPTLSVGAGFKVV